MMVRNSMLKGLPVVTVDEGRNVGNVNAFVVDPDTKEVRYMRVGSGGLFGSGQWVPMSAIRALGTEVVTIDTAESIRESGEAPDAEEMSKGKRQIMDKSIVSLDGRKLGKVQDFGFSPENYHLTDLFVSSGPMLDREQGGIPADQIQTIGEDVIVVSENTRMTMPSPEPQETDVTTPMVTETTTNGTTDTEESETQRGRKTTAVQ
jgi:uncharacterized protein YrrD